MQVFFMQKRREKKKEMARKYWRYTLTLNNINLTRNCYFLNCGFCIFPHASLAIVTNVNTSFFSDKADKRRNWKHSQPASVKHQLNSPLLFPSRLLWLPSPSTPSGGWIGMLLLATGGAGLSMTAGPAWRSSNGNLSTEKTSVTGNNKKLNSFYN